MPLLQREMPKEGAGRRVDWYGKVGKEQLGAGGLVIETSLVMFLLPRTASGVLQPPSRQLLPMLAVGQPSSGCGAWEGGWLWTEVFRDPG